MEIVFLGTGTSQGVPIIGCKCEVCLSQNAKDKRLRTSIIIKDNERNILIDCGPDFRQQMLRENLDDISCILITHEHRDHIGGIDDVRPINFLKNKIIDIYASEASSNAIKRDFFYAFSENKYPGVPELQLHEIHHNKPFKLNGLNIIPILVWHHKMPVLGFRVKNFTYITDANKIDDEELEKVKGTEILVLNALRKEEHISHFTLEQALELIKKINPKQCYLTHISHQLGKYDELIKELPSNVTLAYDGLRLLIDE